MRKTVKKAQTGMFITEKGDTLRGKAAAARWKQESEQAKQLEKENFFGKKKDTSKPAPKKVPIKKGQAGLKASNKRVGPVDPYVAGTKKGK